MLGHMTYEPHYKISNLNEYARDICVCTIKGAVHTLFFNLLREGKLQTLNVCTEHDTIVQFNINSRTIKNTQRIRMYH